MDAINNIRTCEIININTVRNQRSVKPPIIDTGTELHQKQHLPVQPITSLEHIEMIKEYMLNKKGYCNTNIRNYTYFVLSMNFARRGGDMVKLRVCDVLNEDGSFKQYVSFKEGKTDKYSLVPMLKPCTDALIMYFNIKQTYKMSDWLFPNIKNPTNHISVDGMRIMLKRTVEALGLDIRIGTHSMRKTFAYWAIKNAKSAEDEVMVSQYLRHFNIQTTYHYIGRSQKELDSFVAANAL